MCAVFPGMNMCIALPIVTLAFAVPALTAQDVGYIRAVERAQTARPAELSMTARIASPSEPGSPLVIRGQLLDVAGSPAAEAVVFAYQTDSAGLYDRRENGPHSWRLRGWAKTDAQGRFTFETIRPGSYPGTNTPPHVHFTAFMSNGERYHAGELQVDSRAAAAERQTDDTKITLRLEARHRF